MRRLLALLLAAASATTTGILTPAAAAKTEAWTDTQGDRFRADAVEVLGPLALFRTGARAGRLVPLHLLSAEDCVRFYERTHDKPPRAADWSQAGGVLSRELFSNVSKVQGRQLAHANLEGQPEPAFFILFFGSHSVGKSWEMMGGPAQELYAAIRRDYPGMVEAVFWALRDQPYEQTDMAVGMNMPWLVVNSGARFSVGTLLDLAPTEDYSMMVVSRDGVPFLSSPADSEAAVRKTYAELTRLLALMQPDNPQSWTDRAGYLQAVQPVAFATGRAGPILVGDPLKADALRQAGVQRFDAAIQVAADGRVRRVSFIKPEKDLKPETAQAIGRALLKSVFVAAVDNGRFVDGVFEYHFGPR